MYKKVPSRVDCRWPGGTPRLRKKNFQLTKTNLARRKTVSDLNCKSFASLESEEDAGTDDVFNEMQMTFSSLQSSTSFSDAPTSFETVSEHIKKLFNRLEDFKKNANELESIFVTRKMDKMKETMEEINNHFDDFLREGARLEQFLVDRKTND